MITNRKWLGALCIVAAAVIGFGAGTAWADHTNYTTYYSAGRWPYTVVSYAYTPSARSAFTVARVTDAVNQWNTVSGSNFRFQLSVDLSNNYDPAAGCPAFTRNGLHWRYIDGDPGTGTNTLGKTYGCIINSPTGPIRQNFEVVLDSGNTWYWGTGDAVSPQVDAWSVLTHELGHATGWDVHFDDAGAQSICADTTAQNTMCKTYFRDTERMRTPESHDRSVISTAY